MAYNPFANRLTESPPPRNDAKASWTMQGNAVATAVANTGTYYKMAGNTVDGEAVNFTLADNQATYTGTDTRKFQVSFSGTITTPILLGSQTLAVALLKNGSVILASEVRTTAQALSAPAYIGLDYFVELATNDYIEVAIRNPSTTDDPTMSYGELTIFAT